MITAEQEKWLKQTIEEKGNTRFSLISILLAIQHRYNYLPEELLLKLCSLTEITKREVTEAASFYDQFRLKPAGKHTIKVCIGTACHVKGAEQVFQSFKKDLNIPENEDTDNRRLFTVKKVACLGCCMMAVAVQIDDIIYGWAIPGKTENIINDFLAAEKNSAEKTEPEDIDSQAEIRICLCSSCQAAGAQKVFTKIKQNAAKYKIVVKPMDVGCTGRSFQSPFLQIVDGEGQLFNYANVNEDTVSSILFNHFKPFSFISLFDKLISGDKHSAFNSRLDMTENNQPWQTKQKRIATEHCGELSPTDITAYQKNDGFTALKKVMELSSEAIISEIASAGLRGRGGAGFSTYQKWQHTKDAASQKKYVVCNADEGDPGAFMDRMLLESFPFRIIEGMIIAGKAVGAGKGYIFVRAEYPLAIIRLKRALKIAEKAGILGDNIFNSSYSFKIKIKEGAGAFVCGEETALISAMHGQRGVPAPRPPYPSEKGYKNSPTLINNVETFASIPWIFRHSAERYQTTGTEKNRGTKTFALAGKIARGGLIEVPLGMSLKTIIYEIGGGVAKGRKLKAVQIGGPSGGCIPESMLDTPVDYEALSKAGAMMGSGGLVVLDEYDCMVDIARYFLSFTVDESCGKCTFCRVGLQRMLDILTRICKGEGKESDMQKLEDLAKNIKKGSLCGLGSTAPNPVLSTIKYFRDEYEAHLKGHCPAGKCSDLFSFTMNENCIGCMLCSRNCPVEAIDFNPWNKAEIDQTKCIRCGVCRNICPEQAIEVESCKK